MAMSFRSKQRINWNLHLVKKKNIQKTWACGWSASRESFHQWPIQNHKDAKKPQRKEEDKKEFIYSICLCYSKCMYVICVQVIQSRDAMQSNLGCQEIRPYDQVPKKNSKPV